MTDLPGRKTWTEGDSLLLSAWADKKMPAMDRFLAGDDDAFDEVVKDALELARASMIPDPLDPEPEDDEETITYPDVWDRHGGKITLALCAVTTALMGAGVWAIGAAIVEAVTR